MGFVHLHVHSEYSALDGMIRLADGFKEAESLGQPALALTEHGNLASAWAAQAVADRLGVKFIPGCEFYLAAGDRHARTPVWVPTDDNSTDEGSERTEDEYEDDSTHAGMKARAYMHLTVLARTSEGWRNLVKLNNLAQESIWHKPRIDMSALAAHSDGLIVLTGCLGGPVLGPAVRGNWDEAEANLLQIIAAVGAENTYVEVMEHGNAAESAALPELVALAGKHGVGVVATNDAHHTHEDEQEAHAAWLLVQSKSTFAKPKFQFHGGGYWLRSEAEMRALRPEQWWQDACDTTEVIAGRCAERSLPHPRNLMPTFVIPDGFATNRDYLFHLLREGASTRYGGIDGPLRERVMAEMDVIESAGMVDYFLVVHDLIDWARSTRSSVPGGPEKKPILVGPGRGSAGGSEVAYLLGITQIEPRRYGLLFERFYERGRSEPPDIDIDFPQGRRQEVIQYLRDKYGEDHVASIGTFQIARSRAAIKSAASVLDAQRTGKVMTDLVPMVEAKPMPIAALLNPDDPSTAEYRRLYDRDEVARRIHGIAASFEDVISVFSVHASGVIVSSEPLADIVPLRLSKTRGWVLQWTGPEAEQVGLLKVDVLGLRTLDVIERAAEYILETTGETIDPLALPDPDRPSPGVDAERVDAAWRLIAEGRTAGIFQMESAKMTELGMQVAPRSLDEQSAVVALYRPGPMSANMHTAYARRKRGEEASDYRVFTTDAREQAELEKVLGETHAVWVYQEQLMQLGTVVAGFDAAGRSLLRKAVSKKKADVMAAVGEKFRAGAVTEVRDEEGNVVSIAFSAQTAEVIWNAMLGSASYLFNKAHSATYGALAFMTAFYKANWPAAYAAATLAVTDKEDKRNQVLVNLKREGITVLPPDVNSINASTAPESDTSIRIGLAEVKDMGALGALIADERNARGPYASLHDVYRRVLRPDGTGSAITSAHLKAMVNSGAADAFGPRFGQMTTIGAVTAATITPAMEWGVLERSARQRIALGITLGEHPLIALQEQVRAYRIPSVTGMADFDARPTPVGRIPDADGANVIVLGVLAAWAERPYGKGRLANIRVEGSTSSIGGTIWDRALTDIKQGGGVPAVGDVVVARARVRHTFIPGDPEDPDAEDVTVKELSVASISRVPVVDEVRGEWPSSPLPRIDLTRRADGNDLLAIAEPSPTVHESDGAPVVTEAVGVVWPEEPAAPVLAAAPAPAAVAVLAPPMRSVVLPEVIAPTPPSDVALAETLVAVRAQMAAGGSGVVAHGSVTVTTRVGALEVTRVEVAPTDVPTLRGWNIGQALAAASSTPYPQLAYDLSVADTIEGLLGLNPGVVVLQQGGESLLAVVVE
ncbi:DNA polymerase III subunit alpha [Microbacterium ginsengisoli]